MSQHIGPRTISAIGGSIKRVGNYRIHTFPSELVTDGLVMNLDAGDPRSYPGSGATWTDLSGNGNNGTLNGPTYSNADGGSIAFTRSSLHYVTSSTSTVRTHGSNPFTLEAWARNTINGDYNTVLSTHGSSRQIGFHQGYFMWGGNGGGGNTLIYSGSRNLNQWYHLVMTFDGLGGNIGKLYVDGVLLATGNIGDNGATSTSIVRVGSYATSGTEFLDGNVSIARVYNRALSAAEIAQNYDALKVRYTSYTNTFTPICGGGEGKVEVLCVAGGGGGGANHGGGGGGAGGLIYNSAFSVNSNSPISLSIGSGGIQQNNGSNSTFSSLTAIGGGAGATEGGADGNTGGSGGGGSGYATTTNGGSGTSGQGYSGGKGGFPDTNNSLYGHGGGGGGAGGAGTDGTEGNGATDGTAGIGGSGLSYSISGTTQFYAGGGGGGFWGTINAGGLGGSGIGGKGGENGSGANTRQGLNAIPNTGSGGGGSPGIPGIENLRQGGNGSNGTVIVRYPATDYNVEVLVVGGGGGGGASGGASGGAGGGGGAGGLLYYSSYSVSSGVKYTVTVGSGGAGATYTGNPTVDFGKSGANSIFGSVIAYGGGGGGPGYNSGYTLTESRGRDGGSGGGGGSNAGTNLGGYAVSGQGNNGGTGADGSGADGAGGGGGAGAVGGNGTGATATSYGGNGGIGLTYSITGTSAYYAGGGGGGGQASNGTGGLGGGANAGSPGGNGTANTGGGGGGAQYATGNVNGGDGGSGIIIIAYKGPQRGIGGTVDTTSRPGYTLHRFTTTGTDFFIP